MPVTFGDREQAFEAKFARDEEFRFLVAARRDKLFARWAAARLGKSEEEGQELVTAALAVPGGPSHDRALLRLIADAFRAAGREKHEAELAEALDACAAQARLQMMEGMPSPRPGAGS